MLSPVIEVLGSKLIRTAKVCSANAPGDNVKAAIFSGRSNLGASLGHGPSMGTRWPAERQRWSSSHSICHGRTSFFYRFLGDGHSGRRRDERWL